MNRQKRFRELFRFHKHKVRNLFLYVRGFSYFYVYSIAIECVNKLKYLFCLIVPLKSVRRLQSFPSTATLTLCLRSQWIRQHRARVVNNYLKGQCHEIFGIFLFHESKPFGPLINRLKWFCLKVRFCRVGLCEVENWNVRKSKIG